MGLECAVIFALILGSEDCKGRAGQKKGSMIGSRRSPAGVETSFGGTAGGHVDDSVWNARLRPDDRAKFQVIDLSPDNVLRNESCAV